MLIERIEVEEGFLDGLDVSFSPGLNVLVGPRGTGKTSIIELIRFCLDVPAFTTEAEKAARQHALDVLGTGRVTLTIAIDGQQVAVSRSAGDRSPRPSAPLPLHGITVLSQKEIERVGLDELGRLRLIDDFAPINANSSRSETQLLERLRSLSTEAWQATLQLGRLKETLSEYIALEEELLEAQAQEAEFRHDLAGHAAEQQELERLSDELDGLTLRAALLEQTIQRLLGWEAHLETFTVSAPTIGGWPQTAGQGDPLLEARQAVDDILQAISAPRTRLRHSVEALQQIDLETRRRQAELGDRARALRRTLDAAAKGAGAATARVSRLRESLAARQAVEAQLADLEVKLSKLQERRRAELDHLDQLREEKYEHRAATSALLRKVLGPRIDVRVIRYGSQHAYAAAVASVLRGTRLHYNQLAPALAAAVSPRELVEAAEANDIESIVDITGLDQERVSRVLQAIREGGSAELLAAPLEDAVELRLLDGSDYKLSNNLSTGQRCTIVLPILLEQRGRCLVIDQPEDHLDNGFIADTVVRAIANRRIEDQLIVASHNANIPVLGDASKVIVLASDGRNGRVASGDGLDAATSVEAITRIMEGGREAFARRGDFYQTHGG